MLDLEAIEAAREIQHDDQDWVYDLIESLTDERQSMTVSQWAEKNRYLPPQLTPMPGPYSYKVAPYLKEVADCLSITSPVREFDFIKGAQVGVTVGVLENAIGYFIDHVKTAPVMLLTADAELAKIRLEVNIGAMLEHSDLEHLIQSSEKGNSRKTGRTNKKLEWVGGGYLLPYGAKNADKLRSVSIRMMLEDEVDSFPYIVGKDGNPQKLAEARTNAYELTRKIARISTPLIKGQSRISDGYEKGDKRKYMVPCRSCKKPQELKFSHVDKETGVVSGLTYDWDEDGRYIPGTTRYLCVHCGHEHRNSDKSWMLPRGEWVATGVSTSPTRRSYHLNALYSPVGMYSWEACVLAWFDAWDVVNNQVRDIPSLQEFYNNILGQPFEVKGSKVSFTQVSAHRRQAYRLGEIPNAYAAQFSGSEVLFLTCQVDVHKSNLAVTVMGWCRESRPYVIDYWRFEPRHDEPDCDELSSPVWGRLRELLEEKVYTADDGKQYSIMITLVDAGYSNVTVTDFCATYDSGVYAIVGRERPAKNATIKEFSEFVTQAGNKGYKIVVDHYKDRMAPVLRRDWYEDAGLQNAHHFNAPVDITDKQLKELTVETRREETDEKGNVRQVWYRPGNARNELWDLLGYGYAAVEIFAWQICIGHFELDTIDWPKFWDFIQFEHKFYEDA